MARRGCFPGSFNPLTVAHLAIAEAAVASCSLDSVDLVVSRVALAKEHVDRPVLEDRVAVLQEACSTRPWLGVVVTDGQLLVDISRGYDVLVLGADKWAQVLDPAFYGGSVAARDAAVALLPPLALAPRPSGSMAPPPSATVLPIPRHLGDVSSTGVRAGEHGWMAPEAAAFDARSGAWSDAARYDAWLLRRGGEGTGGGEE
jgi:hypothetical protein